MTDLTPAEREIVERFEQAPDALAEATLTLEQRGELADVLTNLRAGRDGHRQALTYYRRWSEVEAEALAPTVARMVAEAADAREAEVRAGIAQAIEASRSFAHGKNPTSRAHLIGYGTGIRVAARIARSAALAPADNDGEASRG